MPQKPFKGPYMYTKAFAAKFSHNLEKQLWLRRVEADKLTF